MCIQCEKYKKRELLSTIIRNRELQKMKETINIQAILIKNMEKELKKKNNQLIRLIYRNRQMNKPPPPP
jgi:hypothetical protein